jgi:DNA-binding NtrC family response regulator
MNLSIFLKEREILLLDRDSEIRRQVANVFRMDGYRVETTDSAVHAISTVLQRKPPVVVLGSDFDKLIRIQDLVHLLKKCHRQIAVILISNVESLPLIRTIRQEGIYYHALKPVDTDDIEEIRLAVECAFDKLERSCQVETRFAGKEVSHGKRL